MVASNKEAVVASVCQYKRKLPVQVLDAVLAVLQVQGQDDLAVTASLLQFKCKKSQVFVLVLCLVLQCSKVSIVSMVHKQQDQQTSNLP